MTNRKLHGQENLVKWKKGQSGNPKGRAKGSTNWSEVVKRILDDEDLFRKLIKGKKNPEWLESLPKKNASNAIAGAMVVKAMSGDKNAAEWLRKTGFGDKLEINDVTTFDNLTDEQLERLANATEYATDNGSDRTGSEKKQS